MRWWGRLVGVLCGLILFGPVGAIIGFLIGLFLDRQVAVSRPFRAQISEAFFRAVFTCMGYVAKSDGRVSESEIAVARHIMQQMWLNEAQKLHAIELFNQGKASEFDLHHTLMLFKQAIQGQRHLCTLFLQIQMQSAFADGNLSPKSRHILEEIAQTLEISSAEFDRLLHMFMWTYRQQNAYSSRQHSHFEQNGYSSGYQQSASYASFNPLQDAYKVLGVSKETPFNEVKKAYRRLMNQYHPDKLASKGLPEEMIKSATAKAQAIKEAYEVIKKAQA